MNGAFQARLHCGHVMDTRCFVTHSVFDSTPDTSLDVVGHGYALVAEVAGGGMRFDSCAQFGLEQAVYVSLF